MIKAGFGVIPPFPFFLFFAWFCSVKFVKCIVFPRICSKARLGHGMSLLLHTINIYDPVRPDIM